MDADDLDEALSDLGVSSIHSSPPAEEMADGSSNANIGVVPLVASSANLNQVATNTNVPNGSAAVTIVAQGTTNPPARHTGRHAAGLPAARDARRARLRVVLVGVEVLPPNALGRARMHGSHLVAHAV